MPHSEIHGSKLIRSSPRLFAAYHVLHRLCMPRHPLNALTTLDRSHCQCSSSLLGSGIPILLAFARRGSKSDNPDTSQVNPKGSSCQCAEPAMRRYLLQRTLSNNAIDVFDRSAFLELRRAARLRSILRPASRDWIRYRAVRQR